MDKTLRRAARTLEIILNDGRIINQKSVDQYTAFQYGLVALEKTDLARETAIIRYHATNFNASVFQDEYTRRAISAAIRALNKMITSEV